MISWPKLPAEETQITPWLVATLIAWVTSGDHVSVLKLMLMTRAP